MSQSPHWIEISQSALLHNLDQLKTSLSPHTKVMAIVKANAYGHGIIQVVPTIEPQIDFFGVNTLEEALIVRGLTNKPVLILAPISPEEFKQALKYHISLCVHSLEYLNLLINHKSSFIIHLKINTGTNRLGFQPAEIKSSILKIQNSKLNIEGVYTHFHSSDSGSSKTQNQYEIFEKTVRQIKFSYPHALAHCASTSASFLLPQTRLDMVRFGIGLYGLWPDPFVQKHSPQIQLQPVLSWHTRLVQTRVMSTNQTVGYSATFTYHHPGIMGVIPVGYSDGYDRGLSNSGQVWIHGQFCPVIGRVAMNFTCLNLTDLSLPEPEGSTVELIGPHVTADTLAAKLGTINYEIVSRLSPNIPRLLVE